MLSFFPTPYPGEWWYSTISRFYVCSGYQTQAAALGALYGMAGMKHGSLYPGASCAAILNQLPPGIFDIKQVILGNTLLPYYMRMAPRETKEKVLGIYTGGSNSVANKVELYSLDGETGPKFCPICYAEDIGRYGEPYWHRVHQVPLIPACPEHGCRLVQPPINWRFAIRGFTPLCTVDCPPPEFEIEEWERKLSDMIQSFVEMPYFDGPDRSYSNLLWALLSKGFAARAFLKKGALDSKKLLQACSNFFDRRVIEQYFNQADHNIFYRIVNWVYKTPERYALLAVFSGLTPNELFGPDLSLSSSILEQLLKMKESGARYTQRDVLRRLGITASQLEIISDRYALDHFWDTSRGKDEAVRTGQLNLCLTKDEKELVRKVALKNGAAQTSAFAREILMQAIREMAEADGPSRYMLDGMAQKEDPCSSAPGAVRHHGEKRMLQIGVRFHPEEKAQVDEAAGMCHTKPAVFARNVLLSTSREITLQNR